MNKLVLSIVIAAFAVTGVALLFNDGNQALVVPPAVMADDCTSGFGWDCVTPSPRP